MNEIPSWPPENMSAGQSAENNSLIPLGNRNRQVVLRKNSSVVVYDQTSRQLATLSSEHDDARCPTCHQPWPQLSRSQEEAPTSSGPDIIDPQYFRLLGNSLTDTSSPPASPRRRLAQRSESSSIRSDVPTGTAAFEGFPVPSEAPADTHNISSRAFSQGYFAQYFVQEKILGRGGRGVVFLVAHNLNGVHLGQFACKRVRVGDDHEWLRKILVEVQTLQSLSHQNLVSYRHVWLENTQLGDFSPRVPCAYILQQYCNGGDLQNYVVGPVKPDFNKEELKNRLRRRSKGGDDAPEKPNGPKRLSLDEIYSFFRDIASGLRYLHANNLIHRDLKPSNCLLHRSGHEVRVLVSDFGEVQSTTATRKSTGGTGTMSYSAPEVLQRDSPSGLLQNFTVKSDIFSLGMLLYFLCFANLPYQNANVFHEEDEDLLKLRAEILGWSGLDNQKRQRPELPEKLYIFLRRLLDINPRNRPTAADIDQAIRNGAGLSDVPSSTSRSPSLSPELSEANRVTPLDSSPFPSGSASQSVHWTTRSTSIAQRSPTRLRPRSTILHQQGDDEEQITSIPVESHTARPGRDEPSRTLNQSSRQTSWADHSDQEVPLLLPPPPRRRLQFPIPLNSTMEKLVRSVVLLVKIITLMRCCGDQPSNTAIVYPLLLIGILEFIYAPSILIVVGTGLFHAFVLFASIRRQSLCVNPRYEDIPTNDAL